MAVASRISRWAQVQVPKRPEALLLVRLGSFRLTAGPFILNEVNWSTSPVIFQFTSLNLCGFLPLSGFMVHQNGTFSHLLYCGNTPVTYLMKSMWTLSSEVMRLFQPYFLGIAISAGTYFLYPQKTQFILVFPWEVLARYWRKVSQQWLLVSYWFMLVKPVPNVHAEQWYS